MVARVGGRPPSARVHRVAVERAQCPYVVTDRLRPQPLGGYHAHQVLDILRADAPKRPVAEPRLDPDPERHLDGRERAALAPEGLQVSAVATAGFGHVQSVTLHVWVDFAHEPPQLPLGLSRRQALPATTRALYSQPAVDPPAIRPPRAIEGLPARAIHPDIDSPTAV